MNHFVNSVLLANVLSTINKAGIICGMILHKQFVNLKCVVFLILQMQLQFYILHVPLNSLLHVLV